MSSALPAWCLGNEGFPPSLTPDLGGKANKKPRHVFCLGERYQELKPKAE